MIKISPEILAFTDTILARQAVRREMYRQRNREIGGAPEAKDRELLAWAFVLRPHIPIDTAIALMSVAPTDIRGEAISAFLASIPRQSEIETVQ